MFMWDYPPSSFEIRTIGGSLTKLRLDNVHMDDAFSNMIKSNFPFLEELTLEIKSSSGEILDITSLTLRREVGVGWQNYRVFLPNAVVRVFSICHPIYAKTNDQLRLRVAKYLLKLISKGVMGSCEIKNPLDGKCVALTSSSLSLLDTTNPHDFYEFKLSWCSP
ncbi:hypothetical protein Tco_1530842 [Tanacetum coccineum]